LRHLNEFHTARAINFSCYHRLWLLTSEEIIMPFIDELVKARLRHNINILGYVIMPNHVHLVLHPPDNCDLGRIIGHVKARSAGRILKLLRTRKSSVLNRLRVYKKGIPRYAFWQARCYDHNCRRLETVKEKIAYFHLNPVRAGLVANPADWRWSSYRWYHGLNDIVLEIDSVEL